MTTVRYRLEARSGVSAGSRGEVVHRQDMHTVLPGSAVRGALAAAWWHEFGQTADAAGRIAVLFERALTVRPAIPDGVELQAVSAVRCKYPEPTCPTAWQDNAGTAPVLLACPQCGGPLDSGSGWSEPDGLVHRRTRSALMDDGTAADKQLFTRSEIRSGVGFTGELLVDHTLAETEDVQWLTRERGLAVGGQRSVLGHVAWTATVDEEPPAVRGPARTVLRCLSPTILVDDFGAPTLDPQVALRRALATPDLRVLHRWVRTVVVGGWHMRSGLPKQDDWALAPGSTFVLDGVPPDADSWLKLGIGLRTLEGYGDVQLIDRAALPTFDSPAVGTQSTAAGRSAAPTRAAADADTEAPPATADELTTDPREVVRDFADRLPDPLRTPTLRGLLTAARRIGRLRDNGYKGALLTGPIAESLEMPWARDLDPDAREAVHRLLGDESIAEVASRVAAELDAGGNR